MHGGGWVVTAGKPPDPVYVTENVARGSRPLVAYFTLPAVCLLTGKFVIPEISNYASILFMLMFMSIALTSVLEIQWGHAVIDDLWRNEQFWVIGGMPAHLFALFQGLLRPESVGWCEHQLHCDIKRRR